MTEEGGSGGESGARELECAASCCVSSSGSAAASIPVSKGPWLENRR